MLRQAEFWGIVVLFAAAVACNTTRYSAAAFHLPPDGNAAQGKVAFQQLGCDSCHSVKGSDLPQPTAQQPVVVALGGEVTQRPSDAYLVTSMINPSAALAPYPAEKITTDGRSRMPSYADRMSVRQVADVVAFLQDHYAVPRMQTGLTR